jgi:hypothetical protein
MAIVAVVFAIPLFCLCKMHLLLHAKALVAFPGRFGTMDALSTLNQIVCSPLDHLLNGFSKTHRTISQWHYGLRCAPYGRCFKRTTMAVSFADLIRAGPNHII